MSQIILMESKRLENTTIYHSLSFWITLINHYNMLQYIRIKYIAFMHKNVFVKLVDITVRHYCQYSDMYSTFIWIVELFMSSVFSFIFIWMIYDIISLF